MTDREKVINVLSKYKKYVFGDKDEKVTVEEIVALLKAQEPRVMTPVEVMLAESVWLEDIDKEKVIHGLRCSSGGGKHWFVVSSMEAVSAMDADYGVRWRCWTSRPTDTQREAEVWSD